ncbi:MAG: hypothetical protein HY606_06930 [Planctomycetes bacterium]|nr:hypothetical protein [Planctomycetota bacterium]
MVKLLTAIHSGFPRIGDIASEQKLRFEIQKWEKKEITDADLHNTENEVIKEIVSIEEEYLDIVTDGLIKWYDPVSHLLKKTNGVKINGLIRFFDTNFYYRQPIIEDSPSANGTELEEEISLLRSITKKQTKGVITGPVTLTELSLRKDKDLTADKVLENITNILANEVKNAGVDYLQIDDPQIAITDLNQSLINKMYEKITKSANTKTILSVYFVDGLNIAGFLNNLPVDIVGIDTTYSPNFFNRLKTHNISKSLQLGIVDARNTALEDADELANQLKIFLNDYNRGELILSPSASLEYLPRSNAISKLKILSDLKSKLK